MLELRTWGLRAREVPRARHLSRPPLSTMSASTPLLQHNLLIPISTQVYQLSAPCSPLPKRVRAAPGLFKTRLKIRFLATIPTMADAEPPPNVRDQVIPYTGGRGQEHIPRECAVCGRNVLPYSGVVLLVDHVICNTDLADTLKASLSTPSAPHTLVHRGYLIDQLRHFMPARRSGELHSLLHSLPAPGVASSEFLG